MTRTRRTNRTSRRRTARSSRSWSARPSRSSGRTSARRTRRPVSPRERGSDRRNRRGRTPLRLSVLSVSALAGGSDYLGLWYLDLALEDLPGRRLRKLVGDPHHARVLVRGHALLHVGANLLRRRVGAVLERDRRRDLLAQLIVGDAQHRRLAHGRVGVQDLLDL